MGRRFGFQVLLGLVMLAMLAGVGVYTYNLGVAHGLTVAVPATPGGTAPVVFYPRPWGFGFGFFPFFPLFVILFWVFVLRGMFWHRGWRGRGYGYDGVPPAFDEWHRRAHEKDVKS